MLGPLLVEDYAPAVREGLPRSDLTSVSEPADLGAVAAARSYLFAVEAERSPWIAPGPVPLRKPDADERAAAARGLDAAGGVIGPRTGLPAPTHAAPAAALGGRHRPAAPISP
ncbi:hypothetical protein ACFU7Y_41175 [Kitasatospora sp. NPDC057542]|uniref:hypothetical protein n=1 Tax=Kitasatospora sp. NPDC057542 TaxID=3346162 RepID=UPI00369B5720